MKYPADNCYYIDSDPGFEYIEGNRDPFEHPKHIKDIANAMLKHVYIPMIIVGIYKGHKYIIDGQHRCEAAKMLWEQGRDYKLGVQEYNSVNPFLEAINYNNTSIRWSFITYIKGFAIQGEPNYIKFLEWLDSKDWGRKTNSCSIALALLGVTNRIKLKEGVFIPGMSFSEANKLYDIIRPFPGFSTIVTNEASAKAFYRLFAHNYNNLVEFIENYSRTMPPFPNSSTIKDWIEFYTKVVTDQPSFIGKPIGD